MPQARGFAQSYTVRPTCNSNGQCRPNTATFGFNDTNWREWPVQPRPEEHNSKSVGGTIIPTPAPVPERQLPAAEGLPAKPAIPSGNPGGTILPPFGPGSTPDLKANGGTATVPSKTPAGQTPPVSIPQGPLGIPGGLDIPSKPDTTPKPDNSGVKPLAPPTESLLPGGIVPEKLTPTPDTPAPQPPKTSDKDTSAPAVPIVPPNVTPTPAPKPDQPTPTTPTPSTPDKGSSVSWHKDDAVAIRATTIQNDSPMLANWNASLEPEAVGENHLRSNSFEQPASAAGNPLRCALEGYCPVQLQERDRWVAGNPDFQVSYQGQEFYFSSDAARKQFEAAPEKYAPAHSGNDVVLAVEENRTVPGSVNHSAVRRGRLYLFSNSASLATFQKDPARYANEQRQTPLQIPANPL